MRDSSMFAMTLFAALGSGLMAGVFFAFSTFVMQALVRLPSPHGIAAMQSINIAVLNPWFLGVFFGTAVLCAAEVIFAVMHWHTPGVAYLLCGSIFYLAGVILVTMLRNLPMNNALAILDPVGADSDRRWANYVASWTTWNHVRTAAALGAAALLAVALRQAQ